MIFLAVARRHFANLSFYVKCYKFALNVVQKDILKDIYGKKFCYQTISPQHYSADKRSLGRKTGKVKTQSFQPERQVDLSLS